MGERGGWQRGSGLNGRLRAGLAVGGLLLPFVLGAVGVWNPWNLAYLDVGFTVPFLGVLFLAGMGLVWHLYARGSWTRAAGFVALVLCLAPGYGVLVLRSELNEPIWTEHVVNVDNDVEADLTSSHNAWVVSLRADRGLLSRKHRVAHIGMGDSGPPAVEARFIDVDELVITAEGEEVYWARFDPGDLDVEEERCRAFRGGVGALPGCIS